MRAYRINIDGRIYEGRYENKANACFGALLVDSDRSGIPWKELQNSPTLIGIEVVTDHKVAKKIHRVA